MPSSVPTMPLGGNNRPFSARPSWAAFAVLGVAVVALGASLIHVQTRPTDGHAVFATADPLQELAMAHDADARDADAQAPLAVTTVAPGETVVAPNPRPRVAAAAAVAPPAASRAAPRAALAPDPPARPPSTGTAVAKVPASIAPAAPAAAAPYVVTESGVVREPAAAATSAQHTVCAGCGRVEAVTPIERPGQAQGVGAVAGGVVGAVVGNQIGKGNGRTVATILGAVGGGMAGHALEKNSATTIVYLVQIRMGDGSVRRLEHPTAPALGTAVVVDGQTLRTPDGARVVSSGGDRAPAAPAPGAKVYGTERN